MIQLSSKKTNELNSVLINKILVLKNTHWSHGIKSQKEFFRKKVLANDLHNLLIINDKLVGYTCLRKKSYIQEKKIIFLF